LLGDWMPLTHGLSEKSFRSRIIDTLPMLLSGRLPPAIQFQVSLEQEGSASLATWHFQIQGKIISASLRPPRDWRRPGWGGLMLMYSPQTSVSTQFGRSPTITFSGDTATLH